MTDTNPLNKKKKVIKTKMIWIVRSLWDYEYPQTLEFYEEEIDAVQRYKDIIGEFIDWDQFYLDNPEYKPDDDVPLDVQEKYLQEDEREVEYWSAPILLRKKKKKKKRGLVREKKNQLLLERLAAGELGAGQRKNILHKRPGKQRDCENKEQRKANIYNKNKARNNNQADKKAAKKAKKAAKQKRKREKKRGKKRAKKNKKKG
jgi:hypothetical protein